MKTLKQLQELCEARLTHEYVKSRSIHSTSSAPYEVKTTHVITSNGNREQNSLPFHNRVIHQGDSVEVKNVMSTSDSYSFEVHKKAAVKVPHVKSHYTRLSFDSKEDARNSGWNV